ncbi:MAG: molybdate transport system ATP-binding protein [Arenicella sp.]|jgi:molybdate transport system ATP-binding protein
MDIHLNKLSVDFDGLFQLEDINWQINSKQHCMIVGANGAGKSALAAVLWRYHRRKHSRNPT